MTKDKQQHDEQEKSPPQELQQQVNDLQTQIEKRSDELATAEAQRDEANMHMTQLENRMAAERLLSQRGTVDVETASLLLARRIDLNEDIQPQEISKAVEELLLDKPFLRGSQTEASSPMPPLTSAPRNSQGSQEASLASAAQRAAASGNRKDIAEYLRLRRQMSTTGI